MRNGLFLALAAALCAAPLHAAETTATTPPPAAAAAPEEDPPLGVFTFLTKIPGDYVATAQTLFSRDALVPWAAVVGSTAVLMKYDYELWQPLSQEHGKKEFFFHASEFGWNVGKGGFQFGIAGGFLALGAILGEHRMLRTASQIVEVVITTGITTQVMKHITGRESPNTITDKRTGHWQWFTNPAKYSRRVSKYDAFPSGHIATTFATEQVIERNFPEQTWIPYVGYPIVAFVATSMVATNGHWWSDYPLSLLLGYHFAKAVTRGNAPHKEDPTALRIDPYMPMPEAAGVLISKQF